MAVVQVIKGATVEGLSKYCGEHGIPSPQDVAKFYDEID
jgi:hypothetical protein